MTYPLHAGLKRSKFLSACGGESILVHLNPNALPGGLIYQLSTLCSEGVTAAPWLGLGGKKVNPWCYQRHPNFWSCLSTVAVHTWIFWILPWILLGIWRVVGYIMSWNKSLYQMLSPKALRVLIWSSKAFFDHSTGVGTAQYILVWQGAALQANESESRSKSPWLLRTAMSFPFTYWQPIFRCSGDPWQNKVKGQLKLRR